MQITTTPDQLLVFTEQYGIGRRFFKLVNDNFADLLRYIFAICPSVTPANFHQLVEAIEANERFTAVTLAAIYGDVRRPNNKTIKIRVTTVIKHVKESFPGESDDRIMAIAALILFIAKQQGFIISTFQLTWDKLYVDHITNVSAKDIADDMALFVLAKSLSTKFKPTSANFESFEALLSWLHSELRRISEIAIGSPVNTKYVNILYSMVAKYQRGELDQIYTETEAWMFAKRIFNFYENPDQFTEVQFEYATLKEHFTKVVEYFKEGRVDEKPTTTSPERTKEEEGYRPSANRFALRNLNDLAQSYTIERLIEPKSHELMSVTVHRNLTWNDKAKPLVRVFNVQPGNYKRYKPLDEPGFEQIASFTTNKMTFLIKDIAKAIDDRRLSFDNQAERRITIFRCFISPRELQLLAYGLADEIIITSRDGVTSMEVIFTANPALQPDVLPSLFSNMTIEHFENELFAGHTVPSIGSSVRKPRTNSALMPIYFATKNGGKKPYMTKTESIEREIDKTFFYNDHHTSTLASAAGINAVKMTYYDQKGEKQTYTLDQISLAEHLTIYRSLDNVACLTNIRHMNLVEQSLMFYGEAMNVYDDDTLLSATTRALARTTIAAYFEDFITSIIADEWVRALASEIVSTYKVPLVRMDTLKASFNYISAFLAAFEMYFRFVHGVSSPIEDMVNRFLATELGLVEVVNITAVDHI